jgi:hypothetical protein
MTRPQLLVALTTLWILPAVAHAAEAPGPLWPSEPIVVSPGTLIAFVCFACFAVVTFSQTQELIQIGNARIE